jgi:protoporphyrin/coproporphyrin ferrochelatase
MVSSAKISSTCPAHAPEDHPAVTPSRVGVLLANLGTPDATDYWSMRRYLSEFLSDKRVVDLPRWKWQPVLQLIILSIRPFKSGAAYRSIWNTEKNESPLLTITRDQKDAIAARMRAQYGDQVLVDFCMRYGNPSTKDRVREMVAAGCDKILFFPLYPQAAGATSFTANDAFFSALRQETWQPAARTVPAYFEHPAYIKALAASVQTSYDALSDKPDILVVSYHGMPKRYLMQGDAYHCQCQKTTRLLREALGWDAERITTTFQSVFGPEEWLKPYTVDEVARLAESGKKKIAVIAPAFSADCIETLEEINDEIRQSFEHAGGERFTYIPCLNDSADHIDALCQVIDENLGGWVR